MTTPPRLTDRTALTLRRARAARNPADFLHRAAAQEVSERLTEVNRRFTRPAILGPMAALWRDLLVADGVIDDAVLAEDAEALLPEAADPALPDAAGSNSGAASAGLSSSCTWLDRTSYM